MTDEEHRSDGTHESFESWLERAAHVPPAAVQTVSPLRAGASLLGGRLQIVRQIGEGGMGRVYEAYDRQRAGIVALKVLTRLDAGDVYLLKNEFRSLVDVRHANLVRLHELFAEGQEWFFTMELVEGERFDHWVRPREPAGKGSGQLDEGRLRRALPQLVSAVLAIHAASKLHRDLKPTNVLVTSAGRVVVLDFGLAVDPELGGVGQTVADYSVSGTPAYMAPEQAAGLATTAASDFYALGVMLFEALTGKLPFEGRAGEIMAAKQLRAAPSVSEAAPDLAALCAQLLALEPSARLTGDDLRARLDVATEPPASDTHARAAPKLVGRDAELSALRDAYAASCDGDKPVIALLSGESGIGKTALVERFMAQLREEGHAVVLSGRCYERENVPFKGFDAVVDELSRHLRKRGSAETAALIPREAYALSRLFPVLGRIPSIAQAPERNPGDAFELRRRGFLALGELFARMRDRQPLVLAIDDLQWSDRDSIALLLHVVRQPDAPRVLVLASHRSEGMRESPVLKPLYDKLAVDMRLDVRRFAIGPLAADAAALLVQQQLGDAGHALLREANGNPFLLGELARAGGASLGRSLSEILRARVAQLPDAERSLLEVIAVAARPLALEFAAFAAGAPDSSRASFEALRSAQLVRSGAQADSVECYHDRIRESVVAALAPEQLRAYHEALARALARTPETDPEHLCEHFELAGQTQLAAEYAARAADSMSRVFAFDQAARLYDKALRSGVFDDREEKRMRIALGDALGQSGHGVAAAEAYLRACERATETEALGLKPRAAAQYLFSGRLELGRALLPEVLRPLGVSLPGSPASERATRAFANARLRLRGFELPIGEANVEDHRQLARVYGVLVALGPIDPSCCAALNAQLLRRALDQGDARIALLGLQLEIMCRTLGVGNPTRVPELFRQAQALLETLSDPRLEGTHRMILGFYEYLGRTDGDPNVALDHIERFLVQANAEPRMFATYRASAQFHRANVLSMLGRFTESTRELPALLDEGWQRDDLAHIASCMGPALLGWLAVGAEAEAQRELARAAQAWSALNNPYTSPEFMLHMGQVSLNLHQGDTRGAWARCLAHDALLSASSMSRSPLFAVGAQFLRRMIAARLAAETPDISERNALLHEAERPPQRSLSRGFVQLPLAAAACARGDRDQAVHLLRSALGGSRPPLFGPIHTQAARRRLGVLLDGDEGKALVAEADAFFRAGGTRDPQRFVGVIIPGCEIR